MMCLLPIVCDTHYGVRHDRSRDLRRAQPGGASRLRRRREPAAAAHARLRLRAPRGARRSGRPRRRQHPLPAPAPAREAGPPRERVEHRRGAAAQVLPHLPRRRALRPRPARRVARHRAEPPDHRLPGRHVMTLTDRYVAATLRRVPADQHADLEQELRASVADAVEAKVEAGTDPARAETDVLNDLGHPDRLAADLAGRPLYLIGPTL